MIPSGDGMSETTRAMFRKLPPHLASTAHLRVRVMSDAGNIGQATTAEHRQDLAKALRYNKSPSLPSFGAAVSRSKGGLSAVHVQLSPTAKTVFQELSAAPPLSLSHLKEPPKSCHTFMMGYGDTSPQDGFPGAPAASRGIPGGGHSKWSFERVPSLLPSHLERDRGLLGRGVAGQPPSASLLSGGMPESLASPCSAWHGRISSQGGLRDEAPGLKHSRSQTALAPKRDMFSGSERLIGTTWDGAKLAAGGGLRGSDGRFLGM